MNRGGQVLRNSAGADAPQRLPGEVGLWLFIVADLLLFGLCFILFARDLAADPGGFSAAHSALDRILGLCNTLLLITGSWAVVMATRVEVNAIRGARYLAGTIGTGLLFLMLKGIEYGHLIGAGHDLTENPFFTWYFVLTGYHALHVIIGLILLGVLAVQVRRGDRVSSEWVEACGCYWHLVDLLWIGIYSFIYLAG